MQAAEKEHVKYRITAFIERLCLNKKLNFQTKITWKRNVNKVETDIVTHQECQSLFQQPLELELNLVYNASEAKFDPKFTEFAITVIYQGKIKSGGYAKFDAAEIVNKNYIDEKVIINLLQCPDPQAYIVVVFNYEVLGESSRSLFNELSMLNPAGFEQDLSQIDFQEDDQRKNEIESMESEARDSSKSLTGYGQNSIQGHNQVHSQSEKENESPSSQKAKEYNKINNILDKFQTMSRRFSNTHKSFLHDDHNSTKNQSLEPNGELEEERLKAKIADLQRELQNREELISQYEKKLLDNCRYITNLENKLQALEERETSNIDRQSLEVLAASENKYKELYQQTLAELQELKASIVPDANFSKQDVKFSKFVQEMQAVNEVPEFQTDRSCNDSQKIEELQRENVELQTKIASMSHNIAQIFNAAYDFGGAKLLDYLQGSIGLIEHDV